jgi:hypothetical protein
MDAGAVPALSALDRAEHGRARRRRARHPEQGFRTCLGVIRLFRGLDPARAETVSARGVAIGALNYESIASILANKLDRGSPARERGRDRPSQC